MDRVKGGYRLPPPLVSCVHPFFVFLFCFVFLSLTELRLKRRKICEMQVNLGEGKHSNVQ